MASHCHSCEDRVPVAFNCRYLVLNWLQLPNLMIGYSLQWRHNGHDGFSNHQPDHCLFNRLFGCRWKKTSKLRVTGLCAGNSPGTGEFPAEMASNEENISIWWRHHGSSKRRNGCQGDISQSLWNLASFYIFRTQTFSQHLWISHRGQVT